MKSNTHIRADIEGLRALAVVLVILYHYQVPGVSGGFVGVDVFFVISGFVITQLLRRAMAKDSFRFADFYARRIRRLVPAFLLASTAAFLLISPFYIGDAYYIFAKSWLASLIGLSNFYYFDELSQYFAPETQTLTLLHTWSLAVEEQFYLLWPATLLLAMRLGKGRDGMPFFVLALIGAFVLSVYMALSYPTAAYYLLPARIFELMLGAGVALFAERLPRVSPALAQFETLAGVALITGTAIFLTSQHPFPGYNALWPTLGTAMVIHAGLHQQGTLVARVLSLPPLVFIGGISYALYLWHWPPVALMHYQLIELTWLNRALVLALVVLMSWVSYRFVENRFRYRDWTFRQSFLRLVFIPLLCIWMIQSYIRLADDLSFRIPAERREIYTIIAERNAADLYKSCFKGDPVDFDKSSRCVVGAPQTGELPDAMLIGDSHAIAQLGFVEQLVVDRGLSTLVVTRASTPYMTTAFTEDLFGVDPTKVARNQALTDYMAQKPMHVFVGAWWYSYLRSDKVQDYLIRTVEALLAQGHTVYILEDVPKLPSDAFAECLLKNMDDCSIPAAPVAEQFEWFERFKAELQSRHPQVRWLNPRAVICSDSRCETVLNGIPLYRDDNHLNHVGSGEIGKEYLKRFGNPLE